MRLMKHGIRLPVANPMPLYKDILWSMRPPLQSKRTWLMHAHAGEDIVLNSFDSANVLGMVLMTLEGVKLLAR